MLMEALAVALEIALGSSAQMQFSGLHAHTRHSTPPVLRIWAVGDVLFTVRTVDSARLTNPLFTPLFPPFFFLKDFSLTHQLFWFIVLSLL